MTVFILVNGEKCRDLDLDPTMPDVELIRDIFICYDIFEFQNPRFFFELSCLQAHRQQDRQTDRPTHTQTHVNGYSIFAVDKPKL